MADGQADSTVPCQRAEQDPPAAPCAAHLRRARRSAVAAFCIRGRACRCPRLHVPGESGNGSTQSLSTAAPGPDPQSKLPMPAPFPESAVRRNKIVFFVNGIDTTVQEQTGEVRGVLMDQAQKNYGAALDQPVVAIHHAKDASAFHSIGRIRKDFQILKSLQTRWTDPERAAAQAYTIDPTVKVIHDQVQAALDAGHDVQLVSHSGGNAQTALALMLLSQENGGRYRPQITQHVRVLMLSGVVSRTDVAMAGVPFKNVLQAGSQFDPLWLLSNDVRQARLFSVRSCAGPEPPWPLKMVASTSSMGSPVPQAGVHLPQFGAAGRRGTGSPARVPGRRLWPGFDRRSPHVHAPSPPGRPLRQTEPGRGLLISPDEARETVLDSRFT